MILPTVWSIFKVYGTKDKVINPENINDIDWGCRDETVEKCKDFRNIETKMTKLGDNWMQKVREFGVSKITITIYLNWNSEK